MSMRPDADAVGELCRLALAAQRLGCRVRLVEVGPDLRDLIVLSGLRDLLLGPPGPDDPPERGALP